MGDRVLEFLKSLDLSRVTVVDMVALGIVVTILVVGVGTICIFALKIKVSGM